MEGRGGKGKDKKWKGRNKGESGIGRE